MPNDLNQRALTLAHLAVEDCLVMLRDSRISVGGPANGLIINERDGSPSSIMRMGTRQALVIGITAYLKALQEEDCGDGQCKKCARCYSEYVAAKMNGELDG